MKYKIAAEVAEADFVRMCEAGRVDHDTSELSEPELKEWLELRSQIVRDLRLGSLIVGDDGRPTYTPPGSSKSFTFHPATGATLMALETYGAGKNISNLAAALAELTRSDRGEFGKMAAPDFQACGRLIRLFLAAA